MKFGFACLDLSLWLPSKKLRRAQLSDAEQACKEKYEHSQKLPEMKALFNRGRGFHDSGRCGQSISLILLGLVCIGFSGLASAELKPVPAAIKSYHDPLEIDAESWILADYDTGWILGGKSIDARIEPASLTKLMTSFLIFEALKTGRLHENDLVFVSNNAWQAIGSRMYIEAHSQVPVIELLKGLVIQSGNDASTALAEHYGGSEASFAKLMNKKAAELGMTNTRFANSSGLPDINHYSTLRDLTLLAMALIRNFPEYYKMYSELEYTYNNITQQNRNMLLTRDNSVDGLKTGYTKKAGYCFIGTAKRDGFRLIAGVMGSKSRSKRAEQVHALIRFGYSAYESMEALKPNTNIVSIPMMMGVVNEAWVGVSQGIRIIYPKATQDRLSASFELPDSINAPLSKGLPAGHIQIKYDSQPVLRASLHVMEDYAEGAWYKKLFDQAKRMLSES